MLTTSYMEVVMFFDRDNDLENLNALYADNIFHFVTLYAASGLGKTRFLNTFFKGKDVLYFSASDTTETENVRQLSFLCCQVFSLPEHSLSSIEDIFAYITDISRRKRIVFVIDNIEYLLRNSKTFSQRLNDLIASINKSIRLFLIVCRRNTLDYKSGGKNVLADIENSSFETLTLRPFTYFEMHQMFPSYCAEDLLCLFALTGGYPGYFKYFTTYQTFDDAIKANYFAPYAPLAQLAESLLDTEFRETATYRAILASLGDASMKVHEILESTALSSSATSNLLLSLVGALFVKKITSATDEDSGRKTLYRISHPILRFWFAFVYPNKSAIFRNLGEDVYLEKIKPKLLDYCETPFQDICRQYILTNPFFVDIYGEFPQIGESWGFHPTKKYPQSADIAAKNDNMLLLGNCFWSDDWVDISCIHELIDYANQFDAAKKRYCLFAKKEFAENIEQLYSDSVYLITLKDMYELKH